MILLACAVPERWDDGSCDARTLAAGEVRARQVPCNDELGGGDARTGDWVIENAVARFFVRGPYAPLTELEGSGGTLVDAMVPGGADLLQELIVTGDRSTIAPENDDEVARLVLPGITYTLRADEDWLEVEGDARLRFPVGTSRTGSVARSGDHFLGVDGTITHDAGYVDLQGVTRVALSPESLWPDGGGMDFAADADDALISVDGVGVDRVDLDDGAGSSWVPPGATWSPERSGCAYDGATLRACGTLHVRAEDDASLPLRVEVTDGDWRATVPMNGGPVDIDPTPRTVWIWAGPGHAAWSYAYQGGEETVDVQLRSAVDRTGVGLADLAMEVAPDGDSTETPWDAGHTRAGENVDFTVAIADDEVAGIGAYTHDPVWMRGGSRGGGVWAWPWSQNSKKPAHGASPHVGALDQLTLAEGGQGTGRLTVVTAEWVGRALAEGPAFAWDPRPDVLWLGGIADLPVYDALLDAWVDVAPAGPWTWVETVGWENAVAYEQGIVEARTTAGTGPRVTVSRGEGVAQVKVEAPSWVGLTTLRLVGPGGAQARAISGAGTWSFLVDDAPAWLYAVVEGGHAHPWDDEPAWAVSAPAWRSPVR